MTSLKKLAALIASGALLLGMMLAATGAASANIVPSVAWTGNGVENGVLGTEQCDQNKTPYLYWVFNPGGNDTVTAATIHFGGTGTGDYAMNQDNGTWKLQNGPWFELDGLTAWVTYTGGLGNGNAVVTISHGCPGTTETAPPTTAPTATPTFQASQGGETTAPTPTFNASNAGSTDAPTLPNTAAIGGNGTSGPADGAWLLVVALGVLLASIVVLTPARAKSRR